ncbi:MAG: hypothetical protein Kow0069_07170 [Promethearchaeota archaeon]
MGMWQNMPEEEKKKDKGDAEDSEDVLKKLQAVRRRLQESLSEGEERKVAPSATGEISLVPGAAEALKAQERAKRAEEQAKRIEELDRAATQAAAPAKAKTRKLYKAKPAVPEGAAAPVAAPPKKVKKVKTKRVTARKMALVQRRVRERVQKTQRISKKRRAAILLTIGVCVVPLLLTSQVAIVTMNFYIDDIAFEYPGTRQGELVIYLPVYNPGILPAYLGIVSLDIMDDSVTPARYVGHAATDAPLSVAPRQKTTLDLRLTLTQQAGPWLKELLSTMQLKLSIRNLQYNGIKVMDNLIPALPPIDVRSLLFSLLGMDDITSMIMDLLGGEETTQAQIANAYARALGLPPVDPKAPRDVWLEYLTALEVQKNKNAQLDELVGLTRDPRASNALQRQVSATIKSAVAQAAVQMGYKFPRTSQFEDLMGDLDLRQILINDFDDAFQVSVVMGIGLPDAQELIGFYLGSIVISHLQASVYICDDAEWYDYAANLYEDDPDEFNDKTPEFWRGIYDREYIRLETIESDYVGEAHSYMFPESVLSPEDYENYTKRDGIALEFGGMAKLGLNVTIFKDDIGGADVHPSAQVNWNDPIASADFVARAKEDYPGWYFLYALLVLGDINLYLQVEDLDITIFGIPIEDAAVTFLPPIAAKEALDINELLGSTIGFGVFDAVGLMVAGAGSGGLLFPAAVKEALPGAPKYDGPDKSKRDKKTPLPGQYNPDADLMEQIEAMLVLDQLDFNEILDTLEETFGDDAILSLDLTIGINNTLFDIFVGLRDTWVGLSNEVDGVERVFAKLELSSEGSSEVFLEGMLKPGDESVPVTASLELYKNETMAAHCEKFLRQLIEEFVIDATFNLHVGRLMLFREKYTWPNIELAVGFELDVWSMLEPIIYDMIADLAGSLSPEEAGTTTQGTGADLVGSTIGLPYQVALGAAFGSPISTFLGFPGGPQAAQDATTGDEGSTDLISTLLGSLLGEDVDLGDLQLEIGVNNLATSTQLFIDVAGLEIPEDLLPIHLGMGYADIDVLTKNIYGGWEPIVNVKIENYLEMPSVIPQSLRLSIDVYHSDTLCNFVEGLLTGGTLNISVDGTMDLNLTGIYLDDLHLALTGERALEDIELGLDIQYLIDDLIAGLEAGTGSDLYPGEFPDWFTGDPDDVLRAAQFDDLSSLLEIGSFNIYKLEERNWPHITNDFDVDIQLGVWITNKLMNLNLKRFEANVTVQVDDWPLEPAVYIDSPYPGATVGGTTTEDVVNELVVSSPVNDATGRRYYDSFGVPGDWEIDPLLTYKAQESWINGSSSIVDDYEYGTFIRFPISVPAGTTLSSAELTVVPTEDVALSEVTNLRVTGLAVNTGGDLRDSHLMNTATTSASVTHAVGTNEWKAGVPVTISVTSVVDEILIQQGAPAGHVVLMLTWAGGDASKRLSVYQFDSTDSNPQYYPILNLSYTTPDPGTTVSWHLNEPDATVDLLINGTTVATGLTGTSTVVPDAQWGAEGWKNLKLEARNKYTGELLGSDAVVVYFSSTDPVQAGQARPMVEPPRYPLAKLWLEEGTGNLLTGIPREVILNLQLNKSIALQNWLNNLIYTFEISGNITAVIELEVFGCQIGPLYINNLDLASLGLSVESLLDAVNPLSERFGNPRDVLVNSPNAAQADLMEMIGKFGLGWLSINQCPWDVGPVNLDTPMMDIVVGVALEPTVNLTLYGGTLQLLDKTIFDAIYDKSPDEPRDWELWNEAVLYSRIAEVSFRQNPVYMNNTYSAPWDPNNFAVDPNKPYFYNYTTEDFNGDGEPDIPDGYTQMETFIQSYRPNYPWLRGWDGLGNVDFTDTNPWGQPVFIPLHNESAPVSVGGTFAWFEIELKMYNMSHPDFQNAYPRDLWRKLGAPFFPVQTFGPDMGGFPEYRNEYHPYFSPFSNLFKDVGLALTDPAALLAGVAFNGSITMNLFSMNITLDVGTPAISDLMGSLTTLLGETLAKTIDAATNPADMLGVPSIKQAGLLEQVGPGRFVPRASQFEDLLGGGLEIDIDSIYNLRAPVLMSERNSHAYFTKRTSNYRWPHDSTNLNPYRTYNYKPGLEEYGGSNRETFFKDLYYDHFKPITENWAKSMNEENPIFESKNPITGEPLEDPKSWALKWIGNDVMGARMRTFVLYFVIGVDLPITVRINSMFAALYNAHTYKPCQYAPMGYAFINETTTLPQGNFPSVLGAPGLPHPEHWMGKKDGVGWRYDHEPPILYQNEEQRRQLNDPATREWIEQAGGLWATDPEYGAPNKVIDRFTNGPGATGGHIYQPSNWLALNLRLFDTVQTFEFFYELLTEEFNLAMSLSVQANVTLFGYDLYNVGMDVPVSEETAHFSEFCAEQYQGAMAGGDPFGVPGSNGTVPIPPPEEEPEWPGSLPGFDAGESDGGFGLSLELDSLTDGLDIGGPDGFDILQSLVLVLSSPTGWGIGLNLALGIQNPIPMGAWITYLGVDLWFQWNETAAKATNDNQWKPYIFNEDGTINQNLWHYGGYVEVDDADVEFDAYPDQQRFDPGNPPPWDKQVPGTDGDFMTDPMENLEVGGPNEYVLIDGIYIFIDGDIIDNAIGDISLFDLIVVLLEELLGIGGGLDEFIQDLIDQFYLLLGIYPLTLYVGIPAEWDYNFQLAFDLGTDGFFNVYEMLQGGDFDLGGLF